MYVLDTDTTSHLTQGNKEALNRRVRSAAEHIYMPVIVAHEMVKGRMSKIAEINAKLPSDCAKYPIAYHYLQITLEVIAKYPILPYTAEDEAFFQALPPEIKRVGPRDCRIGAIAIRHDFTVVTCNLKHFKQIPGVKCIDWTRDD